MHNNNNQELSAFESEHDRVWANLPWFVNETLDADEFVEAKKHLATCLVCRREIASLKVLSKVLSTRTLDPQCETALDRLHARLDENNQQAWTFPWAAAAVLVIVTGLAGIINLNSGLLTNSGANDAYITLGARTTEMGETGTFSARIVFARDVTEFQMRRLLLSSQVELIDGPTPRGAYTIAMSAVTNSADLQTALGKLRDSKQVLFVEPIVGIGGTY
ncbi:MAG: hypothetical protein ACI9BW_002522 [Gammaproteobacteria bacterium]|jgi:hypothetical protein